MPFTIVTALIILPPLLCAVYLHVLNRLRPPRRKPQPKTQRKSRFGFYPLAAGNALQALQAIVQPSAQHTVEIRSDEEADEDDTSDLNDPLQHLYRQAARIRRGEPIDHITALLALPPSSPAPPS